MYGGSAAVQLPPKRFNDGMMGRAVVICAVGRDLRPTYYGTLDML